MKLKAYTKRKIDITDAITNSVGKSIIVDTADTFYEQLENACNSTLGIRQKHDIIRSVFARAIEQSIMDCQIAFVGLFAKLDYCIKEHDVPYTVSALLQLARKELFPEKSNRQKLSDDTLTESFPHNLKATTLLVYYLCGKKDIPSSLKKHFPQFDRKKDSWGKFEENVLRVVVEKWDDDYIWATEEEDNTTIQICYSNDNKILTHDGSSSWDYLNDVLWVGAQLNLVRVRRDESGNIFMPELIILEPDYLINVTTIASCFESYAESPFVNLVNKIKPQANTMPIHLGNLAGRFLDDTVHSREVAFEDSIKQYINANALSMISCPEMVNSANFLQFKQDAEIQKANIEKLIGEDLPKAIGNYDKREVILEPSFFSEVLGIQGRFDFLYQKDGDVTIIEQKSGKGEFVRNNPDPCTPIAKEQHEVQLLLYRALFQYEFQRYSTQLRHTMLLYSKYSKGLLMMPPSPDLLLRAIKMRNLLAWSEIMYAKEGFDLLKSLSPAMLNQKKMNGKLWDDFIYPQLSDLLSPIQQASSLELSYYLRFLRFVQNELLLTKMGNKMKENSGFASVWHDTLEDKKSAGNIYDKLTIKDFGRDGDAVSSIILDFTEPQSSDSTNFRIGDIVILYPYSSENAPNACADMVTRASIVNIKADNIELRLRNSQTDSKVFDKPEGTFWAIEHDMLESMTGSLYSALHGFLSGTKHRRDLILSQRKPDVDSSISINGDYGSFNTLVTHAKQARDMFIIIGPPGTGKTSFGLVNLLKEELSEPDGTVLLLSYTNRAVDEICSKLVEIKHEDFDFDFIRIGSDLSCSEEYREYLLSSRSEKVEGGNGVYKLIKGTRVFCGTTAAINANMSLLKLKHFTLAIVDESSQILEPHLIGLLTAHSDDKEAIDRFVLIGDHKQLPAVVQQLPEESVVTEPELNAIGLTDCRLSLFERLLASFKTDNGYDERYVYMLTKQGRMHRSIAEFPNHAFYASKLDIVPLEHQQLPNTVVQSDNSIIKMLSLHRVAFVTAEEPYLSPSVKTNMVEAEMIAATVYQIYLLNKESFDKDKTVGVIVPYRNQITTVRNAMDKYGVDVLHDITIDTVERYQGSQRDYIIYGFTVHQPYQLNFLTDNVFEEDDMIIDRKLNVAMTRARLNLLMIGNPNILSQNITFTRLMDYVKQHHAYFAVTSASYCSGTFHVPETN